MLNKQSSDYSENVEIVELSQDSATQILAFLEKTQERISTIQETIKRGGTITDAQECYDDCLGMRAIRVNFKNPDSNDWLLMKFVCAPTPGAELQGNYQLRQIEFESQRPPQRFF